MSRAGSWRRFSRLFPCPPDLTRFVLRFFRSVMDYARSEVHVSARATVNRAFTTRVSILPAVIQTVTPMRTLRYNPRIATTCLMDPIDISLPLCSQEESPYPRHLLPNTKFRWLPSSVLISTFVPHPMSLLRAIDERRMVYLLVISLCHSSVPFLTPPSSQSLAFSNSLRLGICFTPLKSLPCHLSNPLCNQVSNTVAKSTLSATFHVQTFI